MKEMAFVIAHLILICIILKKGLKTITQFNDFSHYKMLYQQQVSKKNEI